MIPSEGFKDRGEKKRVGAVREPPLHPGITRNWQEGEQYAR
jgi:hypothetical protein